MRLPTTPVTTLWRDLRDEVRQHYPAGRVISRSTASTARARPRSPTAWPRSFAEDGLGGLPRVASTTSTARGPSATRAAGTPPEGFYRDSYDYATFRRVLIDPFRDGAQTGGDHGLPARRVRRRPRRARRGRVGDRAAGRRAHRRRHLPAPARAARPLELVGLARGARSPSPTRGWPCATEPTPIPTRRANARYRDGQELYLPRGAAAAPRRPRSSTTADLAHPRRVFGDYC